MLQEIANGVIPAVTAAFVGVIIAIIKNVGDAAIKLADVKAKELKQKYNLNKYTELINTAKDIWYIVEEKYRITENLEELTESKAEMFDRLLLQKVPGLKENQLKEIRQALAGEFNKGKKILVTDETLKSDNEELKNRNKELELENSNLKNTISQIQNAAKVQ